MYNSISKTKYLENKPTKKCTSPLPGNSKYCYKKFLKDLSKHSWIARCNIRKMSIIFTPMYGFHAIQPKSHMVCFCGNWQAD